MLRNQLLKAALICCMCFFSILHGDAQFIQNGDSSFNAGSPMTGQLWGYLFGDFYYKGATDALKRARNTQYSGVPKGRTAFQIRRLYLGYNFNIDKKFSTEVLLEAAPGENLTDNKLSFYIKLANLRIKNVWNGTDIAIGQIATPTFAMSSEPIWGYRSIEKTQTDMLHTPSYDLGIALQGKFDPETQNFGYDLMVGNGTGAKPENDNYKWFYGDVWAKFLNKKLYVNVYVDYNKMDAVAGLPHSRNMVKAFVAYTVPVVTVGAEGYINHLRNDGQYTEINTGNADVLSVAAIGVSAFLRGRLIKDKLNAFVRFDVFNPSNRIDNSKYNKYVSNVSGYDPNTKQQFITTGLDYTPLKSVHFMPNVWISVHRNQGYVATGNAADVAYRLTFYYVFGK